MIRQVRRHQTSALWPKALRVWNGVTRFTDIVLRPTLIVAAGTDHDRALRVFDKSEKGRLVAASLSTPIRLEPEIRESETAAALIAP